MEVWKKPLLGRRFKLRLGTSRVDDQQIPARPQSPRGSRQLLHRRPRRLESPHPAHDARAAAPGRRGRPEAEAHALGEQVRLLERYSPAFRERHIENRFPGDLVAVDTFFVGTLKGVGMVYRQTVLDTFSRMAWAHLYTSKLPVTAAHVLNDHVLPVFEEHGIRIRTILSDNGREFCGRPDPHPYELFLQLEGIEHRTTRVRRPQSNGFIERFYRTLLDEYLRVKGRTTWYETLEEMQVDLDLYLESCNTQCPHRARR